jgi:hypothetical protein
MGYKKLLGVLFIVALLAGVVTWETTFAENSVYEPPPHPTGHASSLIVGVPFEDVGNISDAGVINIVQGVNAWGLKPSTNTYFSQAYDDSDTPEKNDLYGTTVASGDFDGNGIADIAIGVAGEDNATGALNVIYFFDNGSSIQYFWAESELFASTGIGDEFGAALVTGDFDGDGYDDLVVGAPGFNNNDGAAFLLYGGPNPVGVNGYEAFYGENQELFGYSLARADFDANGIYDLVVGCPNADIGSFISNRSGKVRILYGPLDVGFVRHQDWTQSATGQGASEAGDEFGSVLATGDFNGDGRADLAIGVPGEDKGSVENTGAVNVLYNDHHDLSKTDAKVWFMGAAQNDKYTGCSLAVGDFDGDGSDDLVIGTPYENSASVEDAGRVDVIWGTPTDRGITTFFPPNDQFKYLGYSLLGINLTGYDHDDLVMGAPGFSSPGRQHDGAIAVSYGGTSGLGGNLQIITQNELAKVAAEDGDDFGYALAELPPNHPASYPLFTPIIQR